MLTSAHQVNSVNEMNQLSIEQNSRDIRSKLMKNKKGNATHNDFFSNYEVRENSLMKKVKALFSSKH